jgi:hypothetical protein
MMSNVTNYLDPAEIAAYDLRQRQIGTAAQRGLYKLTNRKSEATQDFGLAQDRANKNWAESYRRFPGTFARRNVLRSGIYQGARQQSNLDFQNALGDLQRQYERNMGSYNEQGGDIEMQRQMGLESVAAERNARQAQLAAQLREVM